MGRWLSDQSLRTYIDLVQASAIAASMSLQEKNANIAHCLTHYLDYFARISTMRPPDSFIPKRAAVGIPPVPGDRPIPAPSHVISRLEERDPSTYSFILKGCDCYMVKCAAGLRPSFPDAPLRIWTMYSAAALINASTAAPDDFTAAGGTAFHGSKCFLCEADSSGGALHTCSLCFCCFHDRCACMIYFGPPR